MLVEAKVLIEHTDKSLWKNIAAFLETQSSHIIQSIFYSSYWDTNYKFWRLSIISGLPTVSNFLLKKIQHTQKINLQREIKYMKILTGYIIMINHKRDHKINAM